MIFRVIIYNYANLLWFIGSIVVGSFSSWCDVFNLLEFVIIIFATIKPDEFDSNMCWILFERKAFVTSQSFCFLWSNIYFTFLLNKMFTWSQNVYILFVKASGRYTRIYFLYCYFALIFNGMEFCLQLRRS